MTLTTLDFDYVRGLVRDRSAIVLERDKAYLAENRLAVLARREGFTSITQLVLQLRAGVRDLDRKVVEAMTTNETSFFRDLHPFECLRKEVLPLLMQRRAAEQSLKIWCGACSSGQEPYSVAMLLRESFPQLAAWRIRIIASDLSVEMLDRAGQGLFSQLEVNRGLPARMLLRFFQKAGAEWRLKDEIRTMVEFRQVNLVGAWPPLPPVDVVLLRNVLIYFDVETKRQILAKTRRLLRSDGVVFLGGAETTLNLDDGFERVQFERASCFRLRKP